jgi:hypothetical protein
MLQRLPVVRLRMSTGDRASAQSCIARCWISRRGVAKDIMGFREDFSLRGPFGNASLMPPRQEEAIELLG